MQLKNRMMTIIVKANSVNFEPQMRGMFDENHGLLSKVLRVDEDEDWILN